jgi:hypothetical protein
MMKKLALLLCVSATLAACSSNNEGTLACEAATKEMTAAVEKMGNPAMTAMMKQQMDAAKASWAAVTDQKALAAACKQSAEAMKSAMAAMPAAPAAK